MRKRGTREENKAKATSVMVSRSEAWTSNIYWEIGRVITVSCLGLGNLEKEVLRYLGDLVESRVLNLLHNGGISPA